MHTRLSDRIPSTSESFNLIDELLTRQLREGRSARPALVFESHEISYRELAARVSQARQWLISMSVARGDRVGLILPDSPAYVYLLLAAISLGAIAAPINPKLSPGDAQGMLEQVGARIAFYHEGAAAPAGPVIPVESTLERQVQRFDPVEWNRIVPEATSPTDPLYLLFSSGTSGHTKAIIRKHVDNLHVNAAFGDDVLQMGEFDRVLAVPKLTFGYSLVGSLMAALLYGGSSVLLPQTSTAKTILESIARDKPTILLAQPRMLGEMADMIGIDTDLTSVRHVVSAGDILTEPVRERWQKKTGLLVIDGFGSTEAGHIFISRRSSDGGPDCSGRALRGFELKIIDGEGNEVPEGSPGRLCIRGASVSSGYWNDPERTRRQFGGTWHFSDDIFIRHGALYYYSGRWDDMIKTGCGEWVAPRKLETVLLSDPAVRDCAVVGAHDSRNILCVKAYVVRADTNEIDADLSDRLKKRVQAEWPGLDHMRVHMLELIPEIPRSTNGKIERQRLAAKSLTEYAYEC